MLYVGITKQRMTFRMSGDLARALRDLPNQTAFVELALREALGRLCPMCHGTGEAPGVHLAISNFKRIPGHRLDRATAAQLKALVRLGRQLLATELALEPSTEGDDLGFRLAREDEVLLSGRIPFGGSAVKLTH
jgi:hypothetical protein